MRQILSIILFVSLSLPLFSQTVNQVGTVKAISYFFGHDGEPISDVRLKVLTEVRSDAKGEFTIPVTASSAGVFSFESIQKDGYELISPSLDNLSQTKYAINPFSKVNIIMANKTVLYKERRRIENEIRLSCEQQIAQMADKINSLLIQKDSLSNLSVDISTLEKRIVQLQNELDIYRNQYFDSDNDILEKATMLSRIDYQSLDKDEAEIIDMMKNGKGQDVVQAAKNKLSQELWEQLQSDPSFLKKRLDAAQSIADLREQELNTARKIVKFRSEGYSMAFKHDSAAFYLKIYADMDLSDYYGQLEYADYVIHKLNRFDDAIPYINNVLENTDSLTAEAIVAKGYHATILSAKGNDKEAEASFLQAVDWSKQTESKELQWKTLHNLGIFYSNTDRLSSAAELIKETIELKEKYEAESNDIANGYMQLARIYSNLNLFEKAQDCFSKIPEEIDENLSVNLYAIKAGYFSLVNQIDSSLIYFNLALESAKSYYGLTHKSVGDILTSCANLYIKIGQYDKAEEYIRSSLAIIAAIYGEDHTNYYQSWLILGQLLSLSNKTDEAIKGYLTLIDKVSQKENSLMLLSELYTDAAYAFGEKRQYENELDYLEKALDITIKLLGEKHKKTTTIYNNIGITYADIGDFDAAIKAFLKVLEIEKELLGPDNMELVSIYINLGGTYFDKNENEKGLSMYEEALRIAEKDDSNPLLISKIYHNFSTVLIRNKMYDRALNYCQKALDLRLKTDDYTLTVETLNNFATTYEKMEDYEKANEYHSYLIEYSDKYINEENFNTAYAYFRLAQNHYTLGNQEACKKNVTESYRIFKSLFGDDHEGTKAALNLINTCTAGSSPHIYTAEVVDGYQASEKGFSGTYFILAVNDLDICGDENLLNYIQTRPRDTPKKFILMDSDRNISVLDLESGGIGAYLGTQIVSEETMNDIVSAYKQFLDESSR